ncbi:hypothetical protein AO364_0309 [Moraxella catarrhalis]|nr:hypothetical protein AO364_0309 [Moraxella catarrhalis]
MAFGILSIPKTKSAPNQPMTHFGNLYNLIKIATYRNHLISLFAFFM